MASSKFKVPKTPAKHAKSLLNPPKPRLPNNMVREILIRLPAKSVFRFKTISKNWESITLMPSFIRDYIFLNPISSWFIAERTVPIKQIPADSLSFSAELNFQEPPDLSIFLIHQLPNRTAYHQYPKLIASSNGLLLVIDMYKHNPLHHNYLFMIHPITEEYLRFPKSPDSFLGGTGVGFITQINETDFLTERFVVAEYDPRPGSEFASLTYFSSDNAKWVVKSVHCSQKIMLVGDGLYRGAFEFQGNLIWHDIISGLIIWDDPYSREQIATCRFISFPLLNFVEGERMLDCNGSYILYLEVLKKETNEICLWRLLDEIDGQWVIMCHTQILIDFWPSPICIHPFKHNVLFFSNDEGRIFCMDVFRSDNTVSDVLHTSSTTVSDVMGEYSVSVERTSFIPIKLPSWPTVISPCIRASFLISYGHENAAENRFERAIDYFTQCLNMSSIYLSPAQKYDAYHGRAFAKKANNDIPGFREDARQALKLDPSCCHLVS
ncbi:unnamed protein product [Amaranthus hypochondriacus]